MKKDYLYIGIIFVVIIAVVIITSIDFSDKENNSKEKMTQVKFETTQGNIVINLYNDMPITTTNFKKLVSSGFYDGTRFHRVIDGFMIQGGDPLSKELDKKDLWGTGGSDRIDDEFTHASGNKNSKYTISMANAGPNTGSSQFFINLIDNNFLDSKHPVFGLVVEGTEIVDAIGKTATDATDKPTTDIIINKATIL